MDNYSVVVTAIKDNDTEVGKRTKMKYYFEDAVEAVEFYQSLYSQPGLIYLNICTTSADEKA